MARLRVLLPVALLIPVPTSSVIAVHLGTVCMSPVRGEDPGYQGI